MTIEQNWSLDWRSPDEMLGPASSRPRVSSGFSVTKRRGTCTIESWGIFMPQEVTGKLRKLALPYQGPYRVVDTTSHGVSVRPVNRPDLKPILVNLERVTKCPKSCRTCPGWDHALDGGVDPNGDKRSAYVRPTRPTAMAYVGRGGHSRTTEEGGG